MAEEKSTQSKSTLTEFVHINARRDQPGITFQPGHIPEPVALRMPPSANPLQDIQQDLIRETWLTAEPELFGQTIQSFVRHLPPKCGYVQGDFSGASDLACFNAYYFGYVGQQGAFLTDDQEAAVQKERKPNRFLKYRYLKKYAPGKYKLAGVSILHGPAVTADGIGFPECLGISVVECPTNGETFDQAKVDLFFDAGTAATIMLPENQASTPSPMKKTKLDDRAKMLDKLREAIDNEAVFQLVQHFVNNLGIGEPKLPLKLKLDQQKVELNLGITGAEATELYAKCINPYPEGCGEKAENSAPEEPAPTPPPAVLPQEPALQPPEKQPAKKTNKLPWIIGIASLVLFIASLPLTYHLANYPIFAGFASKGLGIATGLAVLGVPFSLYHLCKWAKFTWRECLGLLVSVVGIILTFELLEDSPFSFGSAVMGLIREMGNIMSPASSYGYIVFGVGTVLTLVAAIVYGCCKHQEAKPTPAPPEAAASSSVSNPKPPVGSYAPEGNLAQLSEAPSIVPGVGDKPDKSQASSPSISPALAAQLRRRQQREEQKQARQAELERRQGSPPSSADTNSH